MAKFMDSAATNSRAQFYRVVIPRVCIGARKKTADGRMIFIPENFLVDANGQIIRRI